MQTTPSQELDLPAAISSYFAHETTDTAALVRCFTQDALVVDERHEHRGSAAIFAWNAAANKSYRFKSELLAAESNGAHTTVRAKVSGTFPGSPVELRFLFTLTSGLISRLEIGS
jgi:hypothetical protein